MCATFIVQCNRSWKNMVSFISYLCGNLHVAAIIVFNLSFYG